MPEPARYWMWALGLLVEMATPVFAQILVLEEAPVQRSHLPERFGLFTIIVLGESIVVTGLGVAGTQWAVGSVVVAALGFAAVASLWWLYFDHVLDESAVEHAYTNGVRELFVGFSWAYGHLAIYIGLAATAVGIEFAIGGRWIPRWEGALGQRSAAGSPSTLSLCRSCTRSLPSRSRDGPRPRASALPPSLWSSP